MGDMDRNSEAGKAPRQQLTPGALFYTRMASPVPLTLGREYAQFPNSGDFVAVMLGYLPNGQPPLTPVEIQEMNAGVGLVTMDDVLEALGESQHKALQQFIRARYEKKQ